MEDGHSHSHDLNVKKVDKLSPTRVRLTVEFNKETLPNHEEKTAQRYSRVARIPGFRPGKAPISMVKTRFKDEIRKEVVTHLLEAGLHEAINQSKLSPVSQPLVKLGEIAEGKPFGFEAEFDVQPEIELRKYKGIPLKELAAEVTEKEINETLENLRNRFAVLEPSQSTQPEKGSFAVAEVGFVLADNPEKKDEPKSYTLELGADKLLPALEKAMMEMKVGESREVEETFPEDYSDKELAGKKATFNVKLLELKRKVLPELNDDFAKQIRPESTLEGITKEIRESILSSKEEESKKAQRQEIVDYLVKNNQFDVAPSMVEAQAKQLVQWMEEDWKKRGMKAPAIRKEDEQAIKARAEQMVRTSLVLREVAVKENIALEEPRLQARLELMATQMQQPIEDLKKLLSGRGVMDRIKDELLTDQVYEFLVSQAKISKA